ncbi:MAG: helix-turn-helix transcriptional regulator [Hyphomicrobiales bacterium]|nr:helix-turn-helix transcriptional regulator [Hyphomicrobiales bacterium]
MSDQFKTLVQNLINPLSVSQLEALLDDVVKKNNLAHWQLLQHRVIGNSHERFVVCLGPDSQLFREDELQLIQNALSEQSLDPDETGAKNRIINYWIYSNKSNKLFEADLENGKEETFSCATLKTPFINGTEYVLFFKNKDNLITDELAGNIVSAFLVAWRSVSLFPEFRNVKQIKLGKRERQVLSWTSQGKTSYEISKILNLSEHTINNYVTNAANKLGTNNRVHTVCRAIMLGLI